MRRRWISMMLMALLLLTCLPAVSAEGVYDGLIDDEPVAEEGPLTVESLIAACKEKNLTARTKLMLSLHDYFLTEMDISALETELESAKSDMEKVSKDKLMGLADAAAAEAAQLALDRAQGEYDKAVLEQLKAASLIRGYTDIDVRERGLKADDAYLTLKPADITLAELKDAASAEPSIDEDAEQMLLTLEQNYIDITLYYAEIGAAATAYRTASAARDEVAMAVVMGNADAETFRIATSNMKQAQKKLFAAISDYSKLLYRVNETCGGYLADKAGMLTAVLGSGN